MADERCVYENVLRDASSLCVDIFRKLPAIIMETSDHSSLPTGLIFGTVVQLFRWISDTGELYVRHAVNLRVDIANTIKNRACEHGFRYKGLVKINVFWDEKRLRALKDVRRATRHHLLSVIGIAPLLDWVKTGAKNEVKEQREWVFYSKFGFDELFTVDASLQKTRIGSQEEEQCTAGYSCLVTPEASHFPEHRSSPQRRPWYPNPCIYFRLLPFFAMY